MLIESSFGVFAETENIESDESIEKVIDMALEIEKIELY